MSNNKESLFSKKNIKLIKDPLDDNNPIRLEAFALANTPWKSFMDGVGNSLGYALPLIVVAFFRELLGSGTLFGIEIVPASWYIDNGGFYANNGMMILPPMALITCGVYIWIQRIRNNKLVEEN